MEKLKTTVLDRVAKRGDDGIFQSELWKKLKLSSRDGSRLALKLERQHLIKREKVLESGRWTYKLKIAHFPVSTQSIESAPCLICPVEQKCTLEGEISPRTCPLIEQWVLTELSSSKKTKK
ncbi:MAG: transcriptional regulator [Thaumarchaeota archaeon 13_1_20CM_2_39_20]|nr:MAG: transcriptional regulator [Thaumarchaeota archaeon 13_1_40CM_2_39_13_1]OLE40964.1 MAG: transcriptional regulator [Thaumarchaeota archaeon 13_1_20CM_2_39_20]